MNPWHQLREHLHRTPDEPECDDLPPRTVEVLRRIEAVTDRLEVSASRIEEQLRRRASDAR